MMNYPRFVFISPGINKCQGGTYDHEVVTNEKEHKAAIDAGFSDSVPDALEAAKVAKESIKLDEDKPSDKPKRGRPAKVE
jgi:hypothetical protein